MTEAWILLGVLLFLMVCTAVVAIIYNLRFAGQVTKQFRALGESFSLELTIPERTMLGLYQRNASLYGKYEGREMSIYPRGFGMDNTRQTDTAVRMMTRAPKSLRFSLVKKGLSGKLAQIGRMSDVKTGDASFDGIFVLRSNNPGAAAIFNEEIRQKIKADWGAATGYLFLHDSALTYEVMGLPRTEQERLHIESMTRLMLEIADCVDAWTV